MPPNPPPVKSPTPVKTPTPRPQDRWIAAGYQPLQNGTWLGPDQRIYMPNSLGTLLVLAAQPTATPKPTQTPQELAQRDLEVQRAKEQLNPTVTPAPEQPPLGARVQPNGEAWLPRIVGTANAPKPEVIIYRLNAKNGKWEPAQTVDQPTLLSLWTKALGLDPANLSDADKQAIGEHVKNADPIPGISDTPPHQLGGPAAAEPPTSDLSHPQPPDVLTQSEQQQIVGRATRTGAMGGGGGGGRTQTGAMGVPSMVRQPQAPQGYSTTTYNPTTEDPGHMTYQWQADTKQYVPMGPTGRTTGVTNWQYYDPNRTPASFGRGLGYIAPGTPEDTSGGQPYYGGAQAMLPPVPTRQQATADYYDPTNPDSPYYDPYADPMQGFSGGGRMVLRGPATLIDNATGQPIAMMGERRPEMLTSHPDGSVAIANHVQGFATGGTLDPNNPQMSGAPILGGTPPATTSGGFTGTSFPGTSIGGYNLSGLTAGPLPASTLPWSGLGNIPQGLDVNQLENQAASSLYGLQNYKSNFDTGLQGIYGQINNIRSGALGQEQAAQANDAQRVGQQHLRDTYDPYYSRAGMARPAEVNTPVGFFGTMAGAPAGVGVRWALMTPQQQYEQLNQPLSEYESMIGKTASGVAQQVANALDQTRNALSFLRTMNPSKPNPNGAGLVPSNYKNPEDASGGGLNPTGPTPTRSPSPTGGLLPPPKTSPIGDYRQPPAPPPPAAGFPLPTAPWGYIPGTWTPAPSPSPSNSYPYGNSYEQALAIWKAQGH